MENRVSKGCCCIVGRTGVLWRPKIGVQRLSKLGYDKNRGFSVLAKSSFSLMRENRKEKYARSFWAAQVQETHLNAKTDFPGSITIA